jgi:hypothetical protein
MDYAWSKGLHDAGGYEYDDSLLVFIGNDTIIKFKDVDELTLFANRILNSIPEIRGENE